MSDPCDNKNIISSPNYVPHFRFALMYVNINDLDGTWNFVLGLTISYKSIKDLGVITSDEGSLVWLILPHKLANLGNIITSPIIISPSNLI